MPQTITRSLIETIVRSNLRSLKESPERTSRNLVDMALHFSTGRFQKHFFEIAQEMLHNENCPYYQLVYHLSSNVDNERLIQFGMNIGYNSFTYGAGIIRKFEAQHGFNIPWCITLELTEASVTQTPEHYHQLLHEGKSLGIYAWHIHSHGQLKNFIPIVEMNTDCAFFLYCNSSEITGELLDKMSSLHHIMFVIEFDEDNHDAYNLLQQRKLLYSTFYLYDTGDVPDIINDELMCSIKETNSAFALFFSKESCSDEAKELVQNYTFHQIYSPSYKTIPFDFLYDSQRIDAIISDDSCSVWFDQNGTLLSNDTTSSEKLNHFTHSLSDILASAFPKN